MNEFLPLCKIAEDINRTNEIKGWNENFIISEKLVLMHSEISEAWEVLRDGHAPDKVWIGKDGKPEGFPIEIADLIIRTLHLLHRLNVDIDQVVALKMAYNETRPYRHGGKLS